jgi:hypothetical protein
VRSLTNYLLFQIGWFTCVSRAAEGDMWTGPLAVLVITALHLLIVVRPSERRWELGYILSIGLVGMLADTGLGLAGATQYPSSEAAWASALAPPWITALWMLFGTMPHHSLSWLAERPGLAVVLGALGGPLAFLGGVRFGAVAHGESAVLTYFALALEYAILTPLMLRFARHRLGNEAPSLEDGLASEADVNL